MKPIISLYRPKFVSALVYMLQSVEYDAYQYLRWFWRQSDFGRLQPGRVKPTVKSNLVTVLAGLIYLSLITLAGWLWWQWWDDKQLPALVLATGATALVPAAAAHLLVLPLFLGTWLVQKPLELLQSRHTRRILAGHPGRVIVVAGSYGKTSMKHLLRSVLGTKFKVAVTPGNYNTPSGIGRFARGLSGDEDILIVEAGEYRPGDVARICRLTRPDIGFITGVNEQHMTRMKSVENALGTVFELADCLGEGQPLYVNGDSAYVESRIAKSDLVYGLEGVGKLKVSKLASGLYGTSMTIRPLKGRSYQLKTPLMGRHQAGPIAAAAHLAESLGLTPAQIKRGVADMEVFDRRFKAEKLNGVTVIDDSYNGNPDGFLAGIEFLDDLKGVKRRVYVTPGMTELGRLSADAHYAIGRRLAESDIDQIVFNRNPATVQIQAGLDDGKFKGKVLWLEGQANFLEHLGDYTKAGDVVLLQNSPREDFFYL